MAKFTPREFSLDDLDRAMLKELPVEGTKIGKYLNDGRTVKGLTKAVDVSLPTSVVTGRLMAMKFQGLVLMVKGPTSAEPMYQATQKGKDVLNGSKPQDVH